MSRLRRMVKVFVCDPDENVPVEKCLLHESEAMMTELSNEELYFDLDLKPLIKAHNAYRKTLLNKKIRSRKEHLEKVRLGDLRYAVLSLVEFRPT